LLHFPNATRITDRFQVQKLELEALQEIRIKYRWQTIDQEHEAIAKATYLRKDFKPCREDDNTLKQLLARSRYLRYKTKSK
jgi:transposase